MTAPTSLPSSSLPLPGLSSAGLPWPNAAQATRGECIYFGRVFPLGVHADEPTFVYERRVEVQGEKRISTHVTREPAGAVAISESATHTADYALLEYTLHADQRGQAGSIRVVDGRVTFERRDGGRTRTAVETCRGPIVVGPTLVGFIVRQLEVLRAGRPIDVRLAVLDRLETIGFALSAVEAPAGQTKVRMNPSSFLIRLLVDPIDFTFETVTDKLVRLEGRVPPKVRVGRTWKDFDARVEYSFVAAAYR